MPVLDLLQSLASKIIRRRKRFRDQQGFDYTISIANGGDENAKKSSQWHGSVMDASIQRHKKSDTLFILGSGPSINLITGAEWEHIREHDSVGFNWWMAHDFVPSFYLLQFVKNEALLNLTRDRSPAYKNVPMLLRGDYFATGKMPLGEDPKYDFLKAHELHYMREYAISSRCAIDVRKLFQHVEILGMFTHGVIGPLVPKWRSTLGLLMSWGYQMGYQKIVLCGMDMLSNEHFWHHESCRHLCERHHLPPIPAAQKGWRKQSIMAFTDKMISPNTVPLYVTEMTAWMKERAKVETYIMNTQTLLHPALPVYACKNPQRL